MKKFNILTTAYLSILALSTIQCSDLAHDSGNNSLEIAKANQIIELSQHGINETDSHGRTPLFLAAQYNSPLIKKLLLDNNIDVNKTDAHGFTPLAIAVNEGNLEAVQALIDASPKETIDNAKSKPISLSTFFADVAKFFANDQTKSKRLSLDLRDKRIGYTPLALAARNGNSEIIKLLLQAGANPTCMITQKGKNMPISSLYKLDEKEIADLLANKTKEYTTRGLAFMKALYRDYNTSEARKLLDAGIDVNAKNDRGNTPLHEAAYIGEMGMVKLLIYNKADLNAKNEKGHTPIRSASFHNNKKIIGLLIDCKANVTSEDLGLDYRWK